MPPYAEAIGHFTETRSGLVDSADVRETPDDHQVELAVQTFAMLADRTRLHVVWALREGESSVNELAVRVGKAAATVSQHLAKLRLAGIVTSRRDGNFIHYQLADNHVGELVEEALYHADHLDQDLPDHPSSRRSNARSSVKA